PPRRRRGASPFVAPDGGETLDVDAQLADPNADALAGTVTLRTEVEVALTSGNAFRDVVEGRRYLERPNGQGLLRSSTTGGMPDFAFACGPCDAPSTAFQGTFR